MLRRLIKGWLGERITSVGLFLCLEPGIYRKFDNLIIPDFSGSTQVDHTLVSAFGIFVIEVKNYTGIIIGNPDDANWMQVTWSGPRQFQNPLRQNYRHIRALSAFLSLPESNFIPVVFFVGLCRLEGPMPGNVLSSGLHGYIRGHTAHRLSPAAEETACKKLQALKENPQVSLIQHALSLRKQHGNEENCLYCPGHLVLRVSEVHKRQFFGCSRYPRCNFTRALDYSPS
jgi:restriction system protein